MQLLIINPNTSTTTNSRIRDIAKSVIPDKVLLEVVSADSNIELIETVEQSNATIPAVLSVVEARQRDVDAIVIAAFSDPGLARARSVAACPVFGMSEAAMRVATRTAEQFTIVTLGSALREVIRQNAVAYGFDRQLAEIRLLPWSVARVSADLAAHQQAFAEECARAVEEDGAEAVIIGGGPLSGIADAIQDHLPIPVLDGVRCAVELAMEHTGGQGV